MNRSVYVVLAIIAIMVVLGHGCRCPKWVTSSKEKLCRSDFVGVVEVTNSQPCPPGRQCLYYDISVCETWKGSGSNLKAIQSSTSGAACGTKLPRVPEKYILGAGIADNGTTLTLNSCTSYIQAIGDGNNDENQVKTLLNNC